MRVARATYHEQNQAANAAMHEVASNIKAGKAAAAPEGARSKRVAMRDINNTLIMADARIALAPLAGTEKMAGL